VAMELNKLIALCLRLTYDPPSHWQSFRSESELQIGLSDVGSSLRRIPSRRRRSYSEPDFRGICQILELNLYMIHIVMRRFYCFTVTLSVARN
jgi:hypothetical protein